MPYIQDLYFHTIHKYRRQGGNIVSITELVSEINSSCSQDALYNKHLSQSHHKIIPKWNFGPR